jgi:hypothetical protein
MMVMMTRIHPIFYVLTFATFVMSVAILNKTIMKNELNITINQWGVTIDRHLSEEYRRKKQEYLRKYNLKEIKTNNTRTALEPWN